MGRRTMSHAAAAAVATAAVFWAGVRLPGPPAAPPAGPSRADFDRVREGMTLAEVEAALGPAGPNLSSDTRRDYYIWAGPDGWSYVWIVGGKVVRLAFDPARRGDG